VNKVAAKQIFTPVLVSSVINITAPTVCAQLHVLVALIRGEKGRSIHTFQKGIFTGNREARDRKVI
jgi:hypothetical protein